MTKKQTFAYCAIVALITNVALIPVYKKRREEEKRQEAELMKQVDDKARDMVNDYAEELKRKWQEES